METAEEFVRGLQECVRVAPPDGAYFAPDETQRRVEARDNATRLALLEELAYALRRRQSGEGIWIGPLDALALAVDDILEKNGRKLWGLSRVRRWAIAEPQPVQPTQEK